MPTKATFTYHSQSMAYWTYHTNQSPTILMIHGFRGTHHGLDKIIESLPGYKVVVPDLPGFGESGTLDVHDLDHYVAFLHAFIEEKFHTDPPILLGHSFGSIICAHFAAASPTSINKLILVNPIGSPALKGPMKSLTYLAIFYYWLGSKLPARISKSWLSARFVIHIMTNAMAKTKDPVMYRYILDQHLAHFSSFANSTVVSEAFQASVSHTASEVANQLTLPTLIIAGEKDDITPLHRQEAFARAVASSSLVIIPKVGHLIHYETPETAGEAIDTFIRSDAHRAQ